MSRRCAVPSAPPGEVSDLWCEVEVAGRRWRLASRRLRRPDEDGDLVARLWHDGAWRRVVLVAESIAYGTVHTGLWVVTTPGAADEGELLVMDEEWPAASAVDASTVYVPEPWMDLAASVLLRQWLHASEVIADGP